MSLVAVAGRSKRVCVHDVCVIQPRKLGGLVNSGDEIETLVLLDAEPGALAEDNWTASWPLALTGKGEPANPTTT
jgi:hypothetical protein